MSLLLLLEDLNFSVDRIKLQSKLSSRPEFIPVHYPFKGWSEVENMADLEGNDQSVKATNLLESNDAAIKPMWENFTYGMVLEMYRVRIERLKKIAEAKRKAPGEAYNLTVWPESTQASELVIERKGFIAQASQERNLSKNERIAVDFEYIRLQWYLYGKIKSESIYESIRFTGGLSGGYRELFFILTIFDLCGQLHKDGDRSFNQMIDKCNIERPAKDDIAEGAPLTTAKQLCRYYIQKNEDMAHVKGVDEVSALVKEKERKRKAGES
jgi:hypothetical protein